MMNRLSHMLPPGGTNGQPHDDAPNGFAVNPFMMGAAPWQVQIYQAAFLQAQKQVEASQDEWPLAEWCD